MANDQDDRERVARRKADKLDKIGPCRHYGGKKTEGNVVKCRQCGKVVGFLRKPGA